jgi:catechol 2,3-dioxygenase-like lactoylglutathione lyase family enzyme
MIQARRLGHATFTTPQLERQVEYYREVIGLAVVEKTRTRAILATKQGQEALELLQGEEAALTRIAFQASPREDLAELGARLTQAGVKWERRTDITPGVPESIAFADNRGVMVDVFTQYNFAPDDRKMAGVTPVKFGHVASRVRDIAQTVKFYVEILGFRVSDWRGDFFVFMRCSPDHHTVNFLRDDRNAIHHIAFEVKDWAEIQRACEFLARNNIPLVWGPGRHIIGHNIACYHLDPAGLRVEFFTEMDQMKDEELGYFEPRPWHQDRPQRPKQWGPETLRNYWGYGSERPPGRK